MTTEVGHTYVSVIPSLKDFGKRLEAGAGPAADKAGKDAGSRYSKGILSGLGGVKAAMAGLFAGAAVGSFFKGAIAEARESQRVGRLTEQVIKSTGSAAGITAKQVGDLAGAISNKTGIDDEAIQSGANLLLTFTNVRNEVGKGNDIFNQATGLVTDMSVALGQDAKAGALQLGKALNDPIKGVSALSRVGVSFTAQQKAQIETLVKSGNVLGAQKIIVGELGKEFGGAAAAAATPAQKLSVQIGNIKESIGTALLPAVDGAATLISTKLLPAFGATSGFVSRNITVFKILGAAIVGLTALTLVHATVMKVQAAGSLLSYVKGLRVLSGVTKAQAALQWALNAALIANPIGLVIVGIAALGAALVLAYKKSETFRGFVQKAWELLKKFVGFTPLGALIENFDQVKSVVGDVIGFFERLADKIRNLPKPPGLGLLGKLAGRAVGGPVTAGRGYIVGEEGPEFIAPQRSGYVLTAAQTRAMFAAPAPAARAAEGIAQTNHFYDIPAEAAIRQANRELLFAVATG